MAKTDNFFERLKQKMDYYVHFVYFLTKKFQKKEIFTTTNQLKRFSLSIILNYIETFARKRSNVKMIL